MHVAGQDQVDRQVVDFRKDIRPMIGQDIDGILPHILLDRIMDILDGLAINGLAGHILHPDDPYLLLIANDIHACIQQHLSPGMFQLLPELLSLLKAVSGLVIPKNHIDRGCGQTGRR